METLPRVAVFTSHPPLISSTNERLWRRHRPGGNDVMGEWQHKTRLLRNTRRYPHEKVQIMRQQ